MILKKILKNTKKWMTLLELMIGMAVFAIIMTMIMSSIQTMMVSRIKSMNRIALTDELYFFSEQFFTAIKNGGTIDYEEYWNRKMVGTETEKGHYKNPTGVGNYGAGGDLGDDFGDFKYFCRSLNANEKMSTAGCAAADLNSLWKNQNGKDQVWKYQRYGQYELQFWDYNANADIGGQDYWDQNKDGNIVGDEDDRNLLDGPVAIDNPKEIYLINTEWVIPTRTFFRWNIYPDPNAPAGQNCNTPTSEGCIGNIQILRLEGYDMGSNHDNTGSWVTDGEYDTWVCADGWNCSWSPVTTLNNKKISTGQDAEWKNLFPNSINVRKLQIKMFPYKDPWLSAGASDCNDTDNTCVSPFIHPYMQFSVELGFSHGARRAIRNENPVISVSTTVNLSDFK